LTNVVWPQRADGSRHFTPPVIEIAPAETVEEPVAISVETAINAVTEPDAEPNTMPWLAIIGGVAVAVTAAVFIARRKK
jgi:LPXTG-motif cell wall-anchored protein